LEVEQAAFESFPGSKFICSHLYPSPPTVSSKIINSRYVGEVWSFVDCRSMPLEILHGAFVLLRCCAGVECPKIPPLPRLRVLLARIEAIFAGGKFPYHAAKLAHPTLAASRSADLPGHRVRSGWCITESLGTFLQCCEYVLVNLDLNSHGLFVVFGSTVQYFVVLSSTI